MKNKESYKNGNGVNYILRPSRCTQRQFMKSKDPDRYVASLARERENRKRRLSDMREKEPAKYQEYLEKNQQRKRKHRRNLREKNEQLTVSAINTRIPQSGLSDVSQTQQEQHLPFLEIIKVGMEVVKDFDNWFEDQQQVLPQMQREQNIERGFHHSLENNPLKIVGKFNNSFNKELLECKQQLAQIQDQLQQDTITILHLNGMYEDYKKAEEIVVAELTKRVTVPLSPKFLESANRNIDKSKDKSIRFNLNF